MPGGTASRRLWVSPRQYRDFGWAWPTHFLASGARHHDLQAGLLTLTGLGLGFGIYWLTAPAPLTEALPAADRAKDLGLINIAYNLPLVVGPLIARVVLGLMNSYPALLAVAGVAPLPAAGTVTRRLTA